MSCIWCIVKHYKYDIANLSCSLLFLAVAAKAPRKQVGGSSGGGSSSSSKSSSSKSAAFGGGGNPLRICEVPSWQKGKNHLNIFKI